MILQKWLSNHPLACFILVSVNKKGGKVRQGLSDWDPNIEKVRERSSYCAIYSVILQQQEQQYRNVGEPGQPPVHLVKNR
eukprot:UN12630